MNTGKKILFTQAGYRKVEEEYEKLQSDRKGAVINLRTAREMGDLSENAAYHAARTRLSSIDHRIRHLQKLLRFAQIAKNPEPGRIGLNSTAILRDSAGKLYTYTLVGDYEADPSKGKISGKSPLGKTLLGSKKGDLVTLDAPSGPRTFQIISIGEIATWRSPPERWKSLVVRINLLRDSLEQKMTGIRGRSKP